MASDTSHDGPVGMPHEQVFDALRRITALADNPYMGKLGLRQEAWALVNATPVEHIVTALSFVEDAYARPDGSVGPVRLGRGRLRSVYDAFAHCIAHDRVLPTSQTPSLRRQAVLSPHMKTACWQLVDAHTASVRRGLCARTRIGRLLSASGHDRIQPMVRELHAWTRQSPDERRPAPDRQQAADVLHEVLRWTADQGRSAQH